MDPCYQPRKKAFAEIDPDLDRWFQQTLVFYYCVAAVLLIAGLSFLPAVLMLFFD